MSDLFKFGVRQFLQPAVNKPLREFIPIFHGWIQRQALPGHLLIDVHDYSHVVNGPGILLVAHEANINLDQASLVYIRKTPATLADTLAAARQTAALLAETDGLMVDHGQCEVLANDRLLAPNDPATAERLRPLIVTATAGEVMVKEVDPRERLTFVVRSAA